MKYSALIHLIIVFFAMQALYTGLVLCIGNLIGVFTLFVENDGPLYMGGAPLYFLSALLTVLLGWLMLTKSRLLTEFFVAKSGFENQLKVRANAKQLLSIFIIFLAISTLLTAIPPLLRNIFYSFIETAAGPSLLDHAPKTTDWFNAILDLILPCLLIIYCRQLTDYFSKNIDLDSDFAIIESRTDRDKNVI